MTTQVINVHPDSLREFAARFRSVQAELEIAGVVFNDAGAIASAAIDGALEDFNGAWSHHRKQLVDDLAGASAFLLHAAAAMEEVDRRNAAGVPPVVHGPTIGNGDGAAPASPTIPELNQQVRETARRFVDVEHPVKASDAGGKLEFAKVGIEWAPNDCKPFVSYILRNVSDGQAITGGTYDFSKSSATYEFEKVVREEDVLPGDIMQIYNPTDPGSYYSGMHTAIVDGAPTAAGIPVIDSNRRWDGLIRDGLFKPDLSKSPGLKLEYFRMVKKTT